MGVGWVVYLTIININLSCVWFKCEIIYYVNLFLARKKIKKLSWLLDELLETLIQEIQVKYDA
jgi:hypothetical protein